MVHMLNLLLDILHIQKFFLLGDYFFVLKKKKYSYIKFSVLVATILMSLLGQFVFANVVVRFVIYIIYIVGLFLLCYEEKKKKLVFMGLWSQFLIACLEEISKVIVVTASTILNRRMEIIEQFCIHIFILIVLYLIGIRIKRNYKMGIKSVGSGYLLIFSIYLCMESVLLIFMGDFAINKIVLENKGIYQSVFLIVSISMLAQVGMVIFLVLQRDVYKEHQNLANDYLNEQKNHYEYLEKREHKTKKFRHDLRQHIYMLHTLNQNGEYKKLDEYIEKMYGVVDSFGNRIYVNNGIVDAVLNKFAAEAEKEGIWLDVKGHLPMENNIDAYELCTIFSNLLSNALEAERECGGKSIRVFCKYTSEHIIVCIENDTMEVKKKINGRNFTTKEDRWNHGFGLENVRECVEKNQGELLMESEGNIFRVTVMLNNES